MSLSSFNQMLTSSDWLESTWQANKMYSALWCRRWQLQALVWTLLTLTLVNPFPLYKQGTETRACNIIVTWRYLNLKYYNKTRVCHRSYGQHCTWWSHTDKEENIHPLGSFVSSIFFSISPSKAGAWKTPYFSFCTPNDTLPLEWLFRNSVRWLSYSHRCLWKRDAIDSTFLLCWIFYRKKYLDRPFP